MKIMLTSRFLVYGAAVRFVTNSDRICSEVRKDFGRFETEETLETDGEVKFVIKKDEKFPLEVPRYAVRESFLPSERATYVLSNRRYIEEKGKYILRVDPQENEVVGYVRYTYNTLPFARFLLKWTIIKVLASKGVFFIHGSCVARDGVASLFVGPSGYGKTWVLVSLLKEGYKMVTDDTILVANGRVLPFYIRSMIHENTLQSFPVLKKGLNESSTRVPKQGWLIDLTTIFPAEREEVYPSNLFSINIWNSEETKIERIPGKEMLSRLLRAYRDEIKGSIWFGWGGREIMEKLFDSYCSLVEKTNCFKVFAGSDVSEFIKAVEAVL